MIPLNDAPVGHAFSQSIAEDGSYTFAAADFASATPSVFDPNDTPANSFQAVRITTLPAKGTLLLNSIRSTPATLSRSAKSTPTTWCSCPAADGNGTNYGNFTFQVQDSGGTAFGGVDLDPTARLATLNVTSVSDEPAGTDGSATVNEDGKYTFSTGRLRLHRSARSDPPSTDPTDPDTLNRVKITTLPTNGTLLRFNGTAEVAVSTGDFILASDIASGRLRFAPTGNQHGAPYATLTFQVEDTGSAAGGGVILDQSPNNFTFNVNIVNDAPSARRTP